MINELTRPTWAEVDLAAIQYNAQAIMAHAQAQTLLAVVKADAYGHGAVATAQALAQVGIHDVAVATVDEGITLRQAGHQGQIALLGVQDVAMVPYMVQYDLTPAVGDLEWVQAAQQLMQADNHLSVQIEVDTGMGRMGVKNTQDLTQLYTWLSTQPQWSVAGVFMHFATADDNQTAYFQQQVERFTSVTQAAGIPQNLLHLANSGAALWHAQDIDTHTIRVGSALFGYNPSGFEQAMPLQLKPALQLYSRLGAVRQLRRGESVSYGATFTAKEDMWVGTLPIGYADGYRRTLQGMQVLVDGRVEHVIGRVTMDQILITLQQPVAVGTKVTLIGQEGTQRITVEDVAQKAQTIPHEILTQLTARIPRVYQQHS
jgi:alanine racemase